MASSTRHNFKKEPKIAEKMPTLTDQNFSYRIGQTYQDDQFDLILIHLGILF